MDIAHLVLEYIKALAWPALLLIVTLVFRRELLRLISRIKKADFPGGISIETFPQQIEDAMSLSKIVKNEIKIKNQEHSSATSIPLNEANKRMIKLTLAPSSSGLDFTYYRNIANSDPNLALAGLRMELEVMLKNVAHGFNIYI